MRRVHWWVWSPHTFVLSRTPRTPVTTPFADSEQVKLALLKLQHEEFLQTIAELCGQQRKPQIPKEAPTAVRDELKLKIRVRVFNVLLYVMYVCVQTCVLLGLVWRRRGWLGLTDRLPD